MKKSTTVGRRDCTEQHAQQQCELRPAGAACHIAFMLRRAAPNLDADALCSHKQLILHQLQQQYP